MTIAYLNGEYLPLSEARISPLDRGFLFGDGIYEVIPSYQGKTVGLTPHLNRMGNGLSALGIELKLERNQLEAIVSQLIEQNRDSISDGNIGVYMHISRGTDTRRHHAYPANVSPTVFAFAFQMPAAQPLSRLDATPLHVALTEDLRWQRCHIKSTSLLGNVMHYQQAAGSGLSETILYNQDREITEASSSNVFIVKNGVVKTPPLDNQLLPGITRSLLLEAMHSKGIPVTEARFTVDELLNADEVWLTSSSKEVAPVTQIDGLDIGDGKVGKVWEAAIKAYNEIKFSG